MVLSAIVLGYRIRIALLEVALISVPNTRLILFGMYIVPCLCIFRSNSTKALTYDFYMKMSDTYGL